MIAHLRALLFIIIVDIVFVYKHKETTPMKKHLLILFPVMALLLAGCSGGEEQPTTSEEATSSAPATSIAPPTTGPAPSDNHLIGIAWNGITQDFVTSVGDSVTLKVTYQGGSKDLPIPEEEKGITWSTSNSSVATIPTDDNDNNIDVSFVGAGSVTITATSIWNSDYTKSIGITVYENDAYHYVWSCGTGDKDKFAAAEGDAMLNGSSWHYLRAKPSDPAGITGSQSLKFGGKVSTDKPNNNEGAITLTLNNTKVVKQIIVSASSGARPTGVDDQGHETTERYGSSKLTMTVGATTYYPETSTPKGDSPETIKSNIPTTLASGNIVLSFTESVSYICLKSIIVIYDHSLSEIVVSPTSPHKVLFEVGETFSADGLVVYAHYVNDPANYNVTSSCNILAPSLSSQGEKTVNITYSEGSIARNTSYTIDVNPVRNIVSVEITGTLTPGTKYEVGDVVDYSELKVVVTWDAVDIHDSLTSELALPTANGGDFTEVTNIYQNAVLDMNNAYAMSLKYRGQSSNNYDVAVGTFIVVDYNVVFDFAALDEAEVSAWTDFDDRTLYDSNMYVAVEANLRARLSGVPAEQVNGLPYSKGSSKIYISTITPNLAIESVSLEFEQWVTNRGTDTETKAKQTVMIHSSILGTYPYSDELANTKDFLLNFNNFEKGTNSIMLSFNNSTSNIGLKKFTIKVKENTNAVLDSITYEGELEKTQYADGEYFDATGITVYANFTDPVTYPRVDITSVASFNGDAALTTGMTQVTCNYADKNIIITGITVVDYIGKTYNMLTSAQDDYSGTYVIANAASTAIMNGSLTGTSPKLENDNNIITGLSAQFSDGKFTGTAEIDTGCFFTIEKFAEGGSTYALKAASGRYLGRGSNSTSGSGSKGENYELTIKFTDGHFVIEPVKNSDNYLGFNSSRCQYAASANFAGDSPTYTYAELYKLAA